MKAYLFAIAFLMFIACNSETRHDEAYEQNTEEEDVDINSGMANVSSISFECDEAVFDENGMPMTTLFAVFNGNRVEVAEVNNCNDVERANYNSYNIDSDAEDATYSFHAGYGQYFYATIEEGKGMIYRVQRGENDSGDFAYEVIGEYGSGGYTKR